MHFHNPHEIQPYLLVFNGTFRKYNSVFPIIYFAPYFVWFYQIKPYVLHYLQSRKSWKIGHQGKVLTDDLNLGIILKHNTEKQ